MGGSADPRIQGAGVGPRPPPTPYNRNNPVRHAMDLTSQLPLMRRNHQRMLDLLASDRVVLGLSLIHI